MLLTFLGELEMMICRKHHNTPVAAHAFIIYSNMISFYLLHVSVFPHRYSECGMSYKDGGLLEIWLDSP